MATMDRDGLWDTLVGTMTPKTFMDVHNTDSTYDAVWQHVKGSPLVQSEVPEGERTRVAALLIEKIEADPEWAAFAFLRDVLTTAVEGGIGYWSVAKNYKPTKGTVTLMEDETDTWPEEHAMNGSDVLSPTDVTTDTVLAGINFVLNPDFEVNAHTRGKIASAMTLMDAGEIDADDADVIMQAALFGELVFG